MKDQTKTLCSTAGESMRLEGVSARGTLRGLLFELDVEQRYRNDGTAGVEAVYTFPLACDAVLLGIDVELAGRRLSTVAVERKSAETRYERAIDEGDTPILVERAADGLCTINLGNLLAGETAVVRLRAAQLLRFQHGSLRFAIPTVVAPRYGDPAKAGLAPHQAPATDLAAGYPFALAVDLHGEVARARLSSPSHAIATEPVDGGVRVSIAGAAYLDRDFVLEVSGLEGRSIATIARDGEGYVALASFCADAPRPEAPRPLSVKLLVDCSGSMSGDSILAARRAMHAILAGLETSDRISFSRFGSHVVHETEGLVEAGEAEVRAAALRVGAMDADLGGTELPAALRAVFALGGTNGAADVLLVTDGETWDAEGLVAEARAARQRVFVVGIGSAPAEGVLRRLAEASGGACEFVAPNEDAEGAILRMFARLRAPRFDRARIVWPAAPLWHTPLPSALFGGETIHAFAGFARAPAGEATLALIPRGGGAAMTASAGLGAPADDGGTLARLAAARRCESAPQEERLKLALDYGLLTPLTHLLVVHERAEGEKAKDLPALAKVAQMHAAGWGGVGSVRSREAPCVDFDRLDAIFVARAAFAPLPRAREPGAAEDDRFAIESGRPAEFEFDGAPAGSPADRRRTLEAFLAGLDGTGGSRLPETIGDLRHAGVPFELARVLADLTGDGHEEADVVGALYDALAALVADSTLDVPVSRHLLRALRHVFAVADDRRALRESVAAALRRWLAGEDAASDTSLVAARDPTFRVVE